MNKIRSWFVGIFGVHETHQIGIGDRIRTVHGMGTITGGNITVKLDDGKPWPNHGNDKTWTFNLSKMCEAQNA